jgi:SAM-dependent methyltransferase
MPTMRRRPQDVDEVNRAAWSRPEILDLYTDLRGWTDPGEQAAITCVASVARGKRILDVGVGAGRTASLLTLLSDEYVAVDYSSQMVVRFRENHPGLDVRECDARDLTIFDDGRFDLVVFSFNGLDAIAHDERPRVLRELHRVLAPGGALLFSAHNLDGPCAREVPWRSRPSIGAARWYRAARFAARLPPRVPEMVRSYRNWLRNRAFGTAGPGWATRVAAAHEFSIVIHYASLDWVRAEVVAAGFSVLEVFGSNDGRSVTASTDTSDIGWFHIVASRA